MQDVRAHITTYGCQMNRLDAELLAHALRRARARVVDDSEAANVLLFLTCSVRAHAEERLFSNVGALKARKRREPDLLVGILGCTAQQFGERIRRRAPLADIVCGPGRLAEVPDLIRRARRGDRPALALDPPRTDGACSARRVAAPAAPEREDSARRGSRPAAHEGADAFMALDARLDDLELARPLGGPSPRHACVTVMRGCDNFCAYCVVPHVRGPERSRRPSAVLDEVRRLVAEGARQITFLGQAVNKYEAEEDGRRWDLADLLAAAADTRGLGRLHFITNHPAAMTDRLAAVYRDVSAVCPYLHMPAQAGSDAVLARMNRGYTAAEYEARVAMVREARPDVAVASDFIVGFPGETAADFEATCALVRRTRFAGGFVFKYSPRPGTAAAQRYPDDVPATEKRRRHQVLLDLVQESAAAENRAMVGRTVPVFIEGPSPNPHLDADSQEDNRSRCGRAGWSGPEEAPPGRASRPGHTSGSVQLRGRTPGGRIVVFDGPADAAGEILEVRLTRAADVTLFGERVG
ncbi:MAG: MiaB/RimO family radical SAM methylthiotransferase [Phycisphaerae bacterium]